MNSKSDTFIKYVNYDLKGLQESQLLLLEEFKRICEKHALKWYAIGGTLLGAVRHKGFIPWDIDIDVAMMRCDYEKFGDLCTKELSSRFSYKSFKNEEHHYSPHAKLYMNNTTMIIGYKGKDNGKHLKDHKGIFIDIFPLDEAPLDSRSKTTQARKIKRLKLLKTYKQEIVYDKGFMNYKLIIKRVIRCLLFPVSIYKINKAIDNSMKKYEGINSGYVVSMASKYSYFKQLMDKNIYGNPQKIKFEDTFIYSPEKTEEYLTQLFGNYLQLPSFEEQVEIASSVIHVDFYKK